MRGTRWTAAEIEQLRALYPHLPTAEVAQRIGRKLEAVYSQAEKQGIRKSAEYLASPHACRLRRDDSPGIRFRFKKGHVPANKGVKGWQAGGRSLETQFKKGYRGGKALEKYQPIGAERLTKDGYLQRKVNDDMPLQARWQMVHHLVWRAAGRDLPPGYCLVFINGDKTDIRLENLQAISRSENMRRNTVQNLPPALVEIVRLRAQVVRKINKTKEASQ